MSYIHKCSYEKGQKCSKDTLLKIVPREVYRYFCFRTFGKENVCSADEPEFWRASTLDYHKKAISYFMVDKANIWNETHDMGNPTRSSLVNNLLAFVIKQQTHHKGKESNVVRALTITEFAQIVNIIRGMKENIRRYSIAAYFIFQYNIIGRIDDVAHMYLSNVKINVDYPYTLLVRVVWSKNINDERNAPDQILLGANDPTYCVLLALAIHLETWIGGVARKTDFLFELYPSVTTKTTSSENTKNRVGEVLRNEVFRTPLFVPEGDTNLGSHSIRKLASTYASNSCDPTLVSRRGRWKEGKKMVDRYISCTLPYPDAKVAGALAVGGPVKYTLKEGCGISDEWIQKHVIPNIYNYFEKRVAVANVLGYALLWGCFDPKIKAHLPASLIDRVHSEYACVRKLDECENPVKKVMLIISGHEGKLSIDEFCEPVPDDSGNDTSRLMGIQREGQLSAIYSKVLDIGRSHAALKATVDSRFDESKRQLNMINSGMQNIGMPRFLQNTSTTNVPDAGTQEDHVEDTTDYKYTLSKCPKDLNILWKEFQCGIGGRAPAKSFTPVQRGRVKAKYYQRNLVWKLISRLTNKGETAETACARIYQAYGTNLSVTKIIKKMQVDYKKGGDGHPDLRD